MKKCFIHAIVLSAAFIIAFGTAHAQDLNPNGFPSGSHYNLNIHGKKADFTCPEQRFYSKITTCPAEGCGSYSVGQLVDTCPVGFNCELTSTQIYGNSIFVPETGEGIKIYMQSGRVGGKSTKATSLPQTELWAIDPCAGDENGATIQLPPGEYNVYARALAKPTDFPSMTVTPDLVGAEDENGNDLVYLGLVTGTGFVKPDGTIFTRPKGKSIAAPITDLFEWTGSVCYLIDPGDGTTTQKWCVDNDNDGIYDVCVDSETIDYTPVYCKSYYEAWIFNIADFVDYVWDTTNSGLKLLQVRFYPR